MKSPGTLWVNLPSLKTLIAYALVFSGMCYHAGKLNDDARR